MLDSSGPPWAPLLMDMYYDIGSLLVVGFLAEPLLGYKTSIVSRGISSVGVVNWKIDSYAAYMSWHTLSFHYIWISSQSPIDILLVFV